MARSKIEFSEEERELLIRAFEDRIQNTEQEFSQPNVEVTKTAFKFYIERYRDVLAKIKKDKIDEYTDNEKLPIVSCVNEVLSNDQTLLNLCKSILEKCGYPKNRLLKLKE